MAGLVIAFGAILYGGYILVRTLLFGNPVPGYPSLLVIMLFLGGVQLMTLGVIGEYLGRVFNETKGRPLYLIEHSLPSRGGAVRDEGLSAGPGAGTVQSPPT